MKIEVEAIGVYEDQELIDYIEFELGTLGSISCENPFETGHAEITKIVRT